MTKVYETEATKRDQELQKFRLRYEMMARMELNTKLAEVNRFLEKRATDLDENNKAKDLVTEQIQKDLSNRLSQSKDELIRIKDQMRGLFTIYKKIKKEKEKKNCQLPPKAVLQNGQNHKPPHVDKNLLP